MPGTIIRALRDAGSNNPLFMIDEIDKMGADFRGDPSSAMLEVLDPEQNETFRDHYLDLPFSLINVMFITTANTLETIPGPLRDRMEVIQLAGYSEEEKLEIAKRYLVPRQIERNGLRRSQISFTDAGLRTIISDYTREAGVRQLEREIGSACRKVARQVAESNSSGRRKVSITEPRVRELLGKRRFFSEARRRRAVHRGHLDARQGQAHDHRPARRGDARVRPGRAFVRPRARGARGARPRCRLVRRK
jgi:ATP-dependent Lon protease